MQRSSRDISLEIIRVVFLSFLTVSLPSSRPAVPDIFGGEMDTRARVRKAEETPSLLSFKARVCARLRAQGLHFRLKQLIKWQFRQIACWLLKHLITQRPSVASREFLADVVLLLPRPLLPF